MHNFAKNLFSEYQPDCTKRYLIFNSNFIFNIHPSVFMICFIDKTYVIVMHWFLCNSIK